MFRVAGLYFRSVEASSLTVQSAVCTSGPAEWDLHFNEIPQVVWVHIKAWETYQGAALFMKEKLVFLLFPCSREGLINILLPAEAFLLQRLPTSPSFDHSLYQQFVRYLGAVKKAFSKHALKLMGHM